MSHDAIEWAWQQRCASGAPKLVLVALADHLNATTGQCNPSTTRLADRCSLTERTVRRCIHELERCKLVTVERRQGLPSRYRLPLNPGQNVRTPRSECPDTPDTVSGDPGHSVTQTVKNRKEPERTGRKRPHALPQDWSPSSELLEWARSSFPQLDLDYECDNFIDYWHGCGKPKLDWTATWRNWMRRSAKQSAKPAYSIGRTARTMDENRRRIDAAMARCSAHDEQPRDRSPQLRLIEGGGGHT